MNDGRDAPLTAKRKFKLRDRVKVLLPPSSSGGTIHVGEIVGYEDGRQLDKNEAKRHGINYAATGRGWAYTVHLTEVKPDPLSMRAEIVVAEEYLQADVVGGP